jgi:hypothetical protein
MAGFEVIVRPVVFPSIRPAPPRVLAPVNDPTQGLAVITGSGGKSIDLPHTWSVSLSRQKSQQQETVRQFDKERVKQVDPNTGAVNPNTYVDVERLKRVRLETDQGPIKVLYSDPPQVNNVEPIETDVTR